MCRVTFVLRLLRVCLWTLRDCWTTTVTSSLLLLLRYVLGGGREGRRLVLVSEMKFLLVLVFFVFVSSLWLRLSTFAILTTRTTPSSSPSRTCVFLSSLVTIRRVMERSLLLPVFCSCGLVMSSGRGCEPGYHQQPDPRLLPWSCLSLLGCRRYWYQQTSFQTAPRYGYGVVNESMSRDGSLQQRLLGCWDQVVLWLDGVCWHCWPFLLWSYRIHFRRLLTVVESQQGDQGGHVCFCQVRHSHWEDRLCSQL